MSDTSKIEKNGKDISFIVKKLLSVIFMVVFALILVFFLMVITTSEETDFLAIGFTAFFAILEIVCILCFKKTRRKNVDGYENLNIFRTYYKCKVIEGLPFPQNAKCKLLVTQDKIIISYNDASATISNKQVISTTVDTIKNIQQVASSSVGSAALGYAFFGILGAAVGGRVKNRKVTTKNKYVSIIYYDKNDNLSNILLEPVPRDIFNLKAALAPYNKNAASANKDIEL